MCSEADGTCGVHSLSEEAQQQLDHVSDCTLPFVVCDQGYMLVHYKFSWAHQAHHDHVSYGQHDNRPIGTCAACSSQQVHVELRCSDAYADTQPGSCTSGCGYTSELGFKQAKPQEDAQL